MKNQKKMLIVLAVAAVVLAALYFFVISPLITADDGTGDEETQKPLEDEIINEAGRVLLFPHYERAQIQAVEIYNSFGKYTVYRNAEDTFVLNGFESVSIDPTFLSSIIVGAGYPLTMSRIAENAEDLSEYGLDAEKDDPAWYRLKTTDGNEYKVFIGKMLVSNAGYYVRKDGSSSVYAVSNSLLDAMLLGKENVVAKQFTPAISTTGVMNVSKFAVAKDGEPVASVRVLTEDEANDLGLTVRYQLVEPAGYNLNVTTYTSALEKFTSFEATNIVAVGLTNSKLKKYGLDNPAYSVYFDYDGEECFLSISEKNEEGNYYVAAADKEVIAEVSADKLDFLDLDVIRWVDQPVFMVNINEVAQIKIESDRISETFNLEGEGQELVVTASSGYLPDVSNFRQFYKTLLCIYIQGYSELSDEEIEQVSQGEPRLLFTYTTRAGITTEYAFYDISERKDVCLINGKGGEFHFLYSHINKISSDCIKILNGIAVDSEDRN